MYSFFFYKEIKQTGYSRTLHPSVSHSTSTNFLQCRHGGGNEYYIVWIVWA